MTPIWMLFKDNFLFDTHFRRWKKNLPIPHTCIQYKTHAFYLWIPSLFILQGRHKLRVTPRSLRRCCSSNPEHKTTISKPSL